MSVLLISGSTRAHSTNTAALRTAASGAPATLWEGLTALPAFVPDGDDPPAVRALRAQLAASDAVVFSTPEYAGALPGSLKNLIDWTVGGGDLHHKPVAWINVAPDGRGDGAYAQLASVLGYVDADVVERCCVRIPVTRQDVGADGLIADPRLGARLSGALTDFAAALAGTPR